MSDPGPDLRPTMIRWRIVFLLAGIVFLGHFNRISVTVAGNAQFVGPGRLTPEQLGLVYSSFLLVYSIGMLPGGWVIDRVGPYRALAGMCLGFGSLTALTGVLGWTGLAITALFVPLLLMRGLAGVTSVPLHPGAAGSVSLWLPLRERSTANGLITAGALLGIALTYPVFGKLMDTLGWESAFVICGGVLVGFGLLWIVLAADRPDEHDACNSSERTLVAEDVPVPRGSANMEEILRLFRNRSLVLLTLSYGTLGYIQYLYFYWIEYYFKNVLNVSAEYSRMSSFIISLTTAIGMAAGGWMSDYLGRRAGYWQGARFMAIGGMGLAAVFSICGLLTRQPELVTLWFSLALGSLGLCEGIFWTTAPVLEKRNGGLACALINTGGNAFGMLAPIVTPVVGLRFGWNYAIILACVMCLIGGLLWLGIKETPPPLSATQEEADYNELPQ